MASYDLGNLSDNILDIDRYTVTSLSPTDVFEFDLTSNSNINLYLHNISAGDDVDLRLFEDSNNNGILDVNDRQVASSIQSGNAADSIDYAATVGTYFAQVERYDAGSNGEAYYDLDLFAPASQPPTPPSTVPTTYQPFDADNVFALNSNPGASQTIYLDFNGHTTTGTRWNSEFSPNIVTAAYDTDGDTSTFSLNEFRDIWQIWQRVSEDFSPFNVNVTTALPTADQLSYNGSGDLAWGVRTVIGGNGAWLGEQVGGVAYLDSFNDGIDTPAFVFEDNLGTVQSVAEATSHEVGHALGLEHDGTSREEYYGGHSNGSTSWGSIMGSSYERELTQWSQGEYTDASNQESDLDIITGRNGFDYRADDYGDGLTNAGALTFNGRSSETYGIIETNTDVDWFAFESTTGRIALDINPFEQGPNLNILAQLRDAAGQIVQTFDPVGSLGAQIQGTVDPGQYYLGVTGTGEGDLATGFSGYGSIGQYSIAGTVA